MSAASAGFLDGLWQSDESVTVGGESFTIPAEFVYSEGESENRTGDDMNETTAVYRNFNEYVSICVESYCDERYAPTISVFDSAVNKTISNKTGSYIEQSGEYSFEYELDGKKVIIATNNLELLKKVIR